MAEDADGNVGLYLDTDAASGELRFHHLAFLLGNERTHPDTDELAESEKMIYVSNGDGANSTSGDLVVARNTGSAIEEAVIATGADYSAV